MQYVYVAGRRLRLDPMRVIGKGGEADIFDIGSNLALKVFKSPDHPDLVGLPGEQMAAAERLKIQQRKLREFPTNMPKHVVSPLELATDQSQQICGYTMAYLQGSEVLMRYAQPQFRSAGINEETVTKIFQGLHSTVSEIHKLGVVIGDFNDLNVLVLGNEAYIIDADSFQFGKYPCLVFTQRFIDPLCCSPKALVLAKPYTSGSDWYAFSVMLMQSLLYVDPYGGVYQPKLLSNKVKHDARPLRRITVFHPEVIYPKKARPWSILSDDLLHFFQTVFEKDKRGEFPIKLLEDLIWRKCTGCGVEYASTICPVCAAVPVPVFKPPTTQRGKVQMQVLFSTNGVILFAALQEEKLYWIYHENGSFRREGKEEFLHGGLDPKMRFRVQGDTTLVAQGNRLVSFVPHKAPQIQGVDSYQNLPMFDSNGYFHYWTANGQLLRDDQFGSFYIGDVLSSQTLFWVGPKFGFGFYRAGLLNVAFVFDAKLRGINDSVKLVPIRGQLVDSTCAFAEGRCWFFTTTREGGKTINRCSVILPNGTVEGTAEAQEGDDSWLGTIRGKTARGNFLLSARDSGVVRVEPQNGQLVVTRAFPDTEPFVSSDSYLFLGKDGLYVVDQHKITLLVIS